MGVTAQALHGAKVCIIPQPENNYRPLALGRRALVAMSGLILTAKLAALALVLLLPSTAELSTITNARILQLTNEQRIKHGLEALAMNDRLVQAATEKAQDMIDNDYFSHISPTGVTPWFWIQRNNYVYTVAGENLAIDFVQAEDVVDAWMASPSHRDNVLQPDYVETGLAVLTGEYQGGTSTVVVHMFGLAAGSVRPSPAASTLPPAAVETTAPAPAAVLTPAPVLPTAAPAVAPSMPSITVLTQQATVQTSVRIQAAAAVGSEVHVQINNTQVANLTIGELGFAQREIDLRQFADGQLELTAWAENSDGLTSQTTQEWKLSKDTTGPNVNRDGLLFIISPETDAPKAELVVPSGEFVKLIVAVDSQLIAEAELPGQESLVFPLPAGTLEVSVLDEIGNRSVAGMVDLNPSIFTERGNSTAISAYPFNTIARRLIIAITLIIVVLLLLAVIIKIRIQHPRMITHATLVILLAVVLLLV